MDVESEILVKSNPKIGELRHEIKVDSQSVFVEAQQKGNQNPRGEEDSDHVLPHVRVLEKQGKSQKEEETADLKQKNHHDNERIPHRNRSQNSRNPHNADVKQKASHYVPRLKHSHDFQLNFLVFEAICAHFEHHFVSDESHDTKVEIQQKLNSAVVFEVQIIKGNEHEQEEGVSEHQEIEPVDHVSIENGLRLRQE